jgi:MFS transporter, NNP family, nitrate/nitrite transporter
MIMNLGIFKKSGHMPTLFSAFFYFDVCFAVWVLNGAMAPFISETFHLTAAQKGLMISVPILSGALMRFPLGIFSQYIGRKNAALVEMATICLALLYGWKIAHSFNHMIIMGLLLGVAGASFGVALSLGSGWFPPQYKGLAMGITGAGNSGTVLATLFGPPLALRYGWNAVYGLALLPMLAAMAVMVIFAKEPPDREQKTLKDYAKVLVDKDAWVFNLFYVVTFGGFIGLTNVLPTYFHDQFGLDKVAAGRFTTAVVIMGSIARVVGGATADRWGGLRVMWGVFAAAILGTALVPLQSSVGAATLVLIFVFIALGMGNGAVFQLVPLRFGFATAVASSLIGEIGALGGAVIPNAMGLSKQWVGSFAPGFIIFVITGVFALLALRKVEPRWTSSWVGPGGKVKQKEDAPAGRVVMVPVYAIDIY